jgi:hypothetical protein
MNLLNLENGLDNAIRRLRLEEGDIVLFDSRRISSEDMQGIKVPARLSGIPCIGIYCEPGESVADAICRLPKDKLRVFVNHLNKIL